MRIETLLPRLGFLTAGLLTSLAAPIGAAVAFPFIDATNSGSIPTGLSARAPLGTDLPSTDVQGLRNQQSLTNPGGLGPGSGWTIIPRFSMAEELTDNAYSVSSPRRFDAITTVSPGISITADTRRLQLNLDYAPALELHAINGPLNALTQQLTATGSLTLVPDFAYVDLRALSGVQSRLGGIAGVGTLGLGAGGGAPNLGNIGQNIGQNVGSGAQGLNRQNEVQTTSFGISPYLLHKFGDFGTAKVGVSADYSHSASLGGFASPPLPIGGTNGQSLLTTEQIAQFTSGEAFGRFQDTLVADVSQGTTRSDATGGLNAQNATSHRYSITNQLSYALNRDFTLMAMVGEESIGYGQFQGVPQISGLTWNVGVTYTPNPDSSFTIRYGRQSGQTTITGDAHVLLGTHTYLTMDYSSSVGTQLENLQNQLNATTSAIGGGLINAVTGGPAFIAANALGSQNGVFRYDTLNASVSSQWDRDTIQATLTWSVQTSLSPSLGISAITQDPLTGVFLITYGSTNVGGQSTDVKVATLTWMHQLWPDLTLNTSASYSFTRRSGGLGNDGALTATAGLQYMLPTGSSLFASYSFFDRVSGISGYSLYESLLLVGFTKRF